ncbi:tRNA selenocysteine 1-associated protein 1 [Cichlidogyrus casuarinus]|uniref:tRNA selenocysteine-associated protein 1 n=1 Tax=Cichlidogyrus casuarinus TaxID=1844966 RepID=A0ABD2QMN8_9PLAT
MDEPFIRKVFESLEERPVSIKVIRNKVTAQTLGYGFIEFAEAESAKNAMMRHNGKPIPGCPQKRFKLNHASYGKDSQGSVSSDHSLFVGELSDDVDDLMLYNAFKKYSSCRSAKIVSANGKSKGYGFVRFTTESDMEKALTEMQNYTGLGAKPIRVSLAIHRKYGTDAAGIAQSLGMKEDPQNSSVLNAGVPDPYSAAVAAAVSGSSLAQAEYFQTYQHYLQQYYASQQMAQPQIEGGQIVAAQPGSDPNQSASIFGKFVPDAAAGSFAPPPPVPINSASSSDAKLTAKLEHLQQLAQANAPTEPSLTSDVLSSMYDKPRHIDDLDEVFQYMEASRWDAFDANLPLVFNVLPVIY